MQHNAEQSQPPLEERSGFVGRVQEQRQFLVALQGLLSHHRAWADLSAKLGPAFNLTHAPGDDSYGNIFLPHGIGGIGKSWLTRRCLMLADGIPNEPPILTLYDDVSVGAPVLEADHLLSRIADKLTAAGYEMYVAAYREARAATPAIVERVTRYQFEHRGRWDNLVQIAAELTARTQPDHSHHTFAETSLAYTHATGAETAGKDAATLAKAYDLLLDQMQKEGRLDKDEAALFRNPPATQAARLVTALKQIAVRQPVVIGLDNLEIVTTLEPLIRDCLVLPTNQSPIVWLLSGRYNLADERIVEINGDSRVVKGYRDLLGDNPPIVWDMSIFGDADLADYLEAEAERRRVSLYIDDDLIEAIKVTSSGVPLVVEMVADALFTMDRDEFLREFALDDRSLLPGERLNAIAERFLRYCLTQPEDLERVQAMALLRKGTDDQALAATWRLHPDVSVRQTLHNLRTRYAFVLPEGLHDAVYDFVRRQLRTSWQASDARERLGNRAVTFFQTRWDELQHAFDDSTLRVRDPHWQRATRDLLNALLWVNPDQAVLFLLPRFVEGLGFDRAFSNGLLLQAEEFLTDSLSTFSGSYASLLHRMRVGMQNIDWAFDEPGEAMGAMLESLLDAPGLSPLHVSILSLWQGNWRVESGQLAEGLAAYQRAEKFLPEDAAGLRRQLAKAFFEISGRYLWPSTTGPTTASPEGLLAAERAVTLDDEHGPAWYNYGAALDAAGRPAEAVDAYQRAIALEPRPATYNALGAACALLERPDDAMAAFEQAIAMKPDYAWPYHNLGRLHATRGDYQQALENYQQAINFHEHDRDRAATWSHFGDAHAALGNQDEAISAYRWASVLNPRAAAPWYGLGDVYVGTGRYREAIDAYQNVITLNPAHAWAQHKLGVIYARRGDAAVAIPYFQQAIAHHADESGRAVSWRSLGDAYSRLNRQQDAIDAYRRAINLAADQPETWNNLGDVYASLNNNQAAIDAYREAVRLNPDYAAPWDSLGGIYAAEGREDEAIDAYSRVIELEPGYAWPYHHLAYIYSHLEDYEQARALYQQALERHIDDPSRAVTWSNLGDVQVALGQQSRAISAYRAATRLAPDYAWPHHNLAEVYEARGEYELAIDFYRQAIERHTTPADRAVSWFNLARVYAALGRHEEAIDAYRQVIILEPDDAEAWNNLGDSYLALDRHGEAAEACRQAIRLDPQYALPYHSLGTIAAATGDHRGAMVFYRQAIERHEDDESRAISFNALGDSHVALAETGDARAAYQHAITLNPALPQPYHSLGALAEHQGDMLTALDYYEQAEARYPAEGFSLEKSRLWNGLGNARRALKQPDEAITAYRRSTEFDPEFAPPWSSLGDVYLDRNDLDRAANSYQQAINLAPNPAHPYHNLGLIAERRGDFEPAIGRFQQALERYPVAAPLEQARSWAHMGNAHRGLGQTSQAIEAYRQAVKLDSHYFEPQVSLGEIYTELDRVHEAIEAYHDALSINPGAAGPWISLGDLYRSEDRYSEAIPAYEEAIALDATSPRPYHGLGIIYEAQHRLPQAIENYEAAISRYGVEQATDQALAWNGLGNIYRQQQRQQPAMAAYRQAQALDDSLPEPYRSLGLIHAQTGQVESAIIFYQRAIERYPAEFDFNDERAVVYNDLGDAYSLLGRWDSAIDTYQRASELDESFALPWYSLGNVYRTLARFDEALEAYNTSIELDPAFGWSYNNLALVYQQRKNYSRAEQLYRQAIELHSRLADKATSWNNLGDVYRAQRQYDNAVSAYQQAIELNPRYARPWNSLGDVYRAQGRSEGVIEAYQQATALEPGYAWPYHNLGLVYKNQRSYPQAINYYQQAIERHQRDIDRAVSWNGLGNVYLAMGNNSSATDAFQKAIQLNPHDPWPYHNLGFVNKQLGKYRPAIGLYLKAIDRFEHDQHRAISWNNLGNVYTALELYIDAAQAYNTAIKLDNAYALPWNSLGEVYARQDRHKEAVQAFEAALERNERYVLAWNNLGDAFSRLDDFDAAVSAYQRAIALDDRYAWPYHNLGLLYDDRGEYELALEQYQKAIDRHASREQKAVLSEKMGDLYRVMGDTDRAIEALRNATAYDPQYASPWYGLGNIYAGLEQDDQAIAAFRKAIELQPDNAWPYHNLALVYEKREVHGEAIVLYQQAIDRHKTDREQAVSWDNLGNVYTDLHRLEDAVHAFQESIRLNPGYALPWNSLGDVFNALGNYPEAVSAYRRAIALDPDYVWAYNSLGTVYVNMGENEKAIATFQQVIGRHSDSPEVSASWNSLGDIYVSQQREDEAIAAFETAIRLNPDYAWPYNRLGAIYERRGNTDQAFALYQQATRRHRQRS